MDLLRNADVAQVVEKPKETTNVKVKQEAKPAEAIGKQVSSLKASRHGFSFGTATRAAQSGTQTHAGPGPIYNVDQGGPSTPRWSFPSGDRVAKVPIAAGAAGQMVDPETLKMGDRYPTPRRVCFGGAERDCNKETGGEMPGPGKYFYESGQRACLRQPPSYTMRARPNNQKPKDGEEPKKRVPKLDLRGPGSYEIHGGIGEKQALSARSNGPRFGFAKGSRFRKPTTLLNMPGGSGNTHDAEFDKARFHTSPRFIFDKTSRDQRSKVAMVFSSMDRGPMANWKGPVLRHTELPPIKEQIRFS